MPGGVSGPCQHSSSGANVQWTALISRYKVEFGKKVTYWYKVLSVEDCHCIWSGYRMSLSIRERRTTYCSIRSPYRPKTSQVTISSVPRRIPVREAYLKSCRPKNKTFIRGASPGISYKLWDRDAGILLPGNGKFVIWKLKSSLLS